MEGQIFNDASKFAMGIESLKFVNLGPYTDPLTAVFKASNMPFRTGVSKAVVLVSCSPCTETSGYSYTSLNSILQQRDITLHILRQTGIQLKNNRSPKTKIYGTYSVHLLTNCFQSLRLSNLQKKNISFLSVLELSYSLPNT